MNILKKHSINPISAIAVFLVLTLFTWSCKDNIVNDAYLNLTQDLRIEDNYDLNNSCKVFKIRVKNFYTSEDILGAEVSCSFSNGIAISKNTGINGIIEIDKVPIPDEDFDITVCYSKNNVQYFTKQRISYIGNINNLSTVYLIKGKCWKH